MDVIVGNCQRAQGPGCLYPCPGEERVFRPSASSVASPCRSDWLSLLTMARFLSVEPREVPDPASLCRTATTAAWKPSGLPFQATMVQCPENLIKADPGSARHQPHLEDPAVHLPGPEGYRVANVPLVLDLPLPPELNQSPSRARLHTCKSSPMPCCKSVAAPAPHPHATDTSYGQRDYILRGSAAQRSSAQPPRLDRHCVTGKAIERDPPPMSSAAIASAPAPPMH